MKLYHVAVQREQNWYVGRVLERGGITTQGRTLDELVTMLRDAIQTLWNEKNVHLELVIKPEEHPTPSRRSRIRKAIV